MKRGSADTGSSSKLRRIMEAPLRALCRARDLYVSSMTRLAEGTPCRGVVGFPGTTVALVPGSYSLYPPRARSSGQDDLRELARAASQGAVGGSLDRGGHAMGGSAVVPRSQSVGMARIDEDRPCDFGGDAMVVGPLRPRSRSCDAAKQKVGVTS